MTESFAGSLPWLLLILGYGILTHGIIFLNDGLFWDGWLVDAWQQNKDKDSMRRFYREVGMPNLYFEHWTIGRVQRRNIAYRTVSLVSLLLMAVFVFLTAVHTDLFNVQQAAVISLLFLSFPAYAVTFDGVASLQYTFKIAFFYAGCFLAAATLGKFDAANILAFVFSLVLFLVAFNANSVVVYFGGFLLFYAWLVHTRLPNGFETAEHFKLIALTVLPLAYWGAKEALAPRHGYYKEYNRIRITPFSVLQVGARSFRYGIDVPIIKPVLEAIHTKSAILVLGGLFLGSLVFDLGWQFSALSKLEAVQILALGYALALLAAMPFMLVGQGASEGGWGSKNFMLFHLPFALVVFGWLALVPQSLGFVLLPLILLANSFFIIRTHLLYIAVSVKDKALIRWLVANPRLGSASVIKISEAHWLEYPFENATTMYRPAYLSCMVKRIWPDRRILAILDTWGASTGRSLTAEEIEKALEETTIRYTFAPQVQPGPQYLVTIAAPTARFDADKFARALDVAEDVNPLKQPAMVRMAIEYLYLKWFSAHRLDTFFDQRFSFSASTL